MRHTAAFLILLIASGAPALAQSQVQKKTAQLAANANPESMPCAQILAMPSSDYIARTTAINDSSEDGQLRGIKRFGSCYDERTDRLAASLARTGKGPTKTARADFATFETTLKDFAAKALADAQPPASGQKAAYAGLYEKQFRYVFYQEFEAKTLKAAKPAAPPPNPPTTTSPAPAATTAESAAAARKQEQARSDADPMTQAKNRFAGLLGGLPDDAMHEVHRAFGEVIGPPHLSEAMRLALFRYAIFLLEPPSAKPFSPPPF